VGGYPKARPRHPMASNTFTRHTITGPRTYSRKGTQGRKPSGLGKPELYRLYAEDEKKLLVLKEKLGCYYNKNEIVRQAVHLALETIYTELVKQ